MQRIAVRNNNSRVCFCYDHMGLSGTFETSGQKWKVANKMSTLTT